MTNGRKLLALVSAPLLCVAVHADPARAQDHTHTAGMVHTPGMTAPGAAVLPTEGGQAAFAAISEIIRLLEADATTDWSRVNLERLRLHLKDMDLVTLRSIVSAEAVPGGAVFTVRGSGDAIGAIQRMTKAHGAMAAADAGAPRIVRTVLPTGVRLAVTARDLSDKVAVTRIRALGFIGLMASGDHHVTHHLMLAKGAAMTDHGH